jgi:protein involved in polysaccharide export with SLBB domain
MGLALEDGDRLMVPARPATVNVFGAVYNQNSFLFEQAQRVEDYLRQAGGPTRTADKGHAFIIRADGSVEPKQGSSPFRRSFESARLNPGDSIVMPEQVFKPGLLRGLRDWTQVFAQMALGAAAINVLR